MAKQKYEEIPSATAAERQRQRCAPGVGLAAGPTGAMSADKPRPSRQAGFIVTVEIILITTILVIGIFVGLAAVRDSLFRFFVTKQSQDIYVFDANGVVLGKAIGFDEHEAPLIPYIDRTVPPLAPDPDHKNFRALIGIRDDRFTSREPVYFIGENCTENLGPPCMKKPSSERADSTGIDNIPATGAVGYLYGLQGEPTYAINRTPGTVIPGRLYRQTSVECPYDGTVPTVGSRYISQKVVLGDACETPFILPLTTAPFVVCNGLVGGPTCPQAAVGAVPACTDDNGTCACPIGYTQFTDALLVNYCCPTGTDPDNILVPVICEGAQLFVAESVPQPDDPTKNALEDLEPPFSVNLPADAGGWLSVPPDGEDPPHLHTP